MGMMGGEDLGALREADPFDRAFIDAMVPHHLMAVHMSQMVRRAGRDARVRQLAARIEAAQRREIEQMNDWRERWYGAPVEGGGPGAGHGAMPGMGPGGGPHDGMGPPAGDGNR
jgi:Domain of unknown function (DUF305)